MDMRIYLGPNRCASGHIHALLKLNESMLRDEKILVVHKEKNRKILMHVRERMRRGTTPSDAYDDFIDIITEGHPDTERVIICDHRMTTHLRYPADWERLYPGMHQILARWANFIPKSDLSFFGAVRSPDTFLPSIYGQSLVENKRKSFAEFLENIYPEQLSWSEAYERGLEAVPMLNSLDIPLYLWRFEDYPKIWREVLCSITGLHDPSVFQPIDQTINPGLSLYGAFLMHKYVLENDVKGAGLLREVKRSFMEFYPNDGRIPKTVYWTPELIKTIQSNYDDDWYGIQRLDNIIALSAPAA